MTFVTRSMPKLDRITLWRIGLIVVGAAVILLGGVIMLQTLKPIKILGVASWFLYAIILHDAVIAGGTFLVQFALRNVGRRIPVAALAIVQGALVIGSIFTLLVIPEIIKRGLGTNNTTVLPFDYGERLAVFWLVLIVVTVIALAILRVVTRVRRSRS